MDPFTVSLVLIAAALVFALIDVFVPSAGILLTLAVVSGIGSVFYGFRAGTTTGMTLLTVVLAAVPVFAFLIVKVWPNTFIGRRVLLEPPEPYVPTAQQTGENLREFIGVEAKTDAPLLPTGQIMIDHHPYNAVAESDLLDAGQDVRVVDVRDRMLVLRAVSTAVSNEGLDTNDSTQQGSLLELPADQLGLDSINEEDS